MSGFSHMESSALKLWGSAQQLLRTMLNAEIYNLWFAPIRAVGISSEALTLEVPNDFSGVWLQENYRDLIGDVLGQCTGESLRIEFVVAATDETKHPAAEAAKSLLKKELLREDHEFAFNT